MLRARLAERLGGGEAEGERERLSWEAEFRVTMVGDRGWDWGWDWD